MHKQQVKQKGSALITALMITAVVAALAALIFLRQAISIRELSLIANADRATQYLEGTAFWAKSILKEGTKKALANNKPLIETFPKILKPTQYKGATISAVLIDQQGLFNINSLTSINNGASFIRLLQNIDPKINNDTAQQLVNNIHDWLTASNADDIYTKKQPPYLAAHQLMTSISELRLVAGFNANLYRKLFPYITALPTSDNKININSAPAIILTTLADNLTLSEAKTIVATRQAKPFQQISDFTNYLKTLSINITKSSNLTVSDSSYFLLHSQAKIANQTTNQYTVLKRTIDKTKKTATISVLAQTLNTP